MRNHSIDENRRVDHHKKKFWRFNWAEAAMVYIT